MGGLAGRRTVGLHAACASDDEKRIKATMAAARDSFIGSFHGG
jgi:hypothetical protein